MTEQSVEDYVDWSMARADLERKEDWRELIEKIPSVRFRPSWQVVVIPPFAGAVARFRASKNGASVSVYLDWYDRLGSVGQPYWEIYPAADGDTARFLVGEEGEMVSAIEGSLRKHRKKASGVDS